MEQELDESEKKQYETKPTTGKQNGSMVSGKTPRPVGSKQKKAAWYSETYPITTYCKDSFTITDQNEINLLRAMEDNDAAAIRRNAKQVKLKESLCVNSMLELLRKKNPNIYQKTYDLIEELKEEQSLQ